MGLYQVSPEKLIYLSQREVVPKAGIRTRKNRVQISGYRYYSPRLGRWITRDPIGERGGINIYSLGMNNPYTFLDYLGLDTRLIQDLIQAKKVRLDHNDIRKIEEIIPDWIGRTWLGIPDWYHVFAMKDALPAKWRCINKWLKKNERNLWDATVGREPVSLTIQSAVVATINGVTVYSYTINIPLGLVLSGVSAYLDVKTGNDVLRLIDNIDLQVYLSLIYSHMKSSSSALEAFERISGVEQGTVTDDEIKELIPWWRLILEWKEIHGFFPQ